MAEKPPHVTPLGIWLLGTGLANGVKPHLMARFFGTTRAAIAGATRRYIHGIKHERTPEEKAARRKGAARDRPVEPRSGNNWEAQLIEPWSVYRARKKAERAAAREREHGPPA